MKKGEKKAPAKKAKAKVIKVVHWTLKNGSGLNRVAEDLAAAERALGLNSVTQDSANMDDWEGGMDGDIHVVHSHIPDAARAMGKPIVWVGHGTPEHVFQSSVEASLGGKSLSNSWMLVNYWLKNADALVTFWPRHQKIWQSLAGKNAKVHCIPMGVDKSFWKKIEGFPRYDGTPSVMVAENAHSIKWPLDLAISWPWITEALPDARLHMYNIPDDQNEFWSSLMYNNGAYFKSYYWRVCLPHVDLVNVFNQVDYYMSPVRYGDFNRLALEANAAGCKVISYRGNPYADFWLTEGDQAFQAEEMKAILSGAVEPREKEEAPDIMDMGRAMVKVYATL